MTFEPTNSLEVPLNENVSFPKEWENFLPIITRFYRDVARKVNDKDRAYYTDEEIVNSQKFYDDTNRQSFHNLYRKVIDCGALPNAGTKTVAHNIAGINNNWMFTRIYGTAREPAGAALRPFFIPLPNAGPSYQVELMVDTTNVNITTAVNLSAFTQSYVILEYWKA